MPNNSEALITNIQRFSLDDGPGIRSTVFFQGCPLACLWCHNPENISAKPRILFLDARCTGCGECARACPANVCNVEGGKQKRSSSACILCGACVEKCVFGACEITGRPKTIDGLVSSLLKDKEFYGSSGGGVTLSGGEPLLNPDFCERLLCELKREGIHTVVDTCGAVEWPSFKAVLPYADLFLYDIKAWGEEKHRALTGKTNTPILNNLKNLNDSGKEIIIRMPLICGLNDDPADIAEISRFLDDLDNVKAIELLPYHSYGVGKYSSLNIPYRGNDFAAPSKEVLLSIRDVLSKGGKNLLIRNSL